MGLFLVTMTSGRARANHVDPVHGRADHGLAVAPSWLAVRSGAGPGIVARLAFCGRSASSPSETQPSLN